MNSWKINIILIEFKCAFNSKIYAEKLNTTSVYVFICLSVPLSEKTKYMLNKCKM